MDGKNSKFALTVKDITMIALLAAILFVQEEAFAFIPNVQFTVFFLVLYSKKLGFFRTSIIVSIHVILDNLVMGSFSLLYTPAMFVGWMFIPILFCTVFKKTEIPVILAIGALLCGFLYSWTFVVPNVIVYSMNPLVYLASDVLFEIILSACGFLTVLLLYKPVAKIFDRYVITKTDKVDQNKV